jgi:hypothetical protein
MYDRNHDRKIDRGELLEVLKMMVGGNIHEDQIATIADHTIDELVMTEKKKKRSEKNISPDYSRMAMETSRSRSKSSARHSNESMRTTR